MRLLMPPAVCANVRSSPLSRARCSPSAYKRGLHVLEQQREVEDLGVLLGGGLRERRVGVFAEYDPSHQRAAERNRAGLQCRLAR